LQAAPGEEKNFLEIAKFEGDKDDCKITCLVEMLIAAESSVQALTDIPKDLKRLR